MYESEQLTEQFLETLGTYQDVSIAEDRIGDHFVIYEKSGREDEVRLSVMLRTNLETRSLNPFISHNIPGTNEWVYIEFPDESEPEVSGAEYDDTLALMELARGGLKIMQAYKSLPHSVIRGFHGKYNSRVYDYRQEDIQLTDDCIERTLLALERSLNEA